jgi:hypothetical protein
MIGCPNARGCIFKTADVMKFAAVEGRERDGAADAESYFAQRTKNAARVPETIRPIRSRRSQASATRRRMSPTCSMSACPHVRKGAVVFSLAVFDSSTTQTTTPTGSPRRRRWRRSR